MSEMPTVVGPKIENHLVMPRGSRFLLSSTCRFHKVDAIGGSRTGGGEDGGSDNEVQRTMLQIVTELDGFDARGNIKVTMALCKTSHSPSPFSLVEMTI